MWRLTPPGDGTAIDESLLNDKSVPRLRFITVLSPDMSQLIEDKTPMRDFFFACLFFSDCWYLNALEGTLKEQWTKKNTH